MRKFGVCNADSAPESKGGKRLEESRQYTHLRHPGFEMFTFKRIVAAFALFGATALHAQNYTGHWYNAAESGWGLNIVHQGDVLFPTWFTYDTDEVMWVISIG